MTSIGGFRNAALQAPQLSLPRLAVGEVIQVNVLGPSRHGVSVQIGQERLQLDVPSRLADARTLTLEGTASSSATGQRVRVVARDERPLPQPLEADLTAKPKPSPPPADDVVHKNEIKVVAQPVNPDGKARGPNVTLHLQAAPPEVAAKATAGQAGQLSQIQANPPTPQTAENRPAATPHAPSQAPADRQIGLTSSPVRQSGAQVVDHGRPVDGLSKLKAQNVEGAQKSNATPAPPPATTSAIPAKSPPTPNKSDANDLWLPGDRSARPQSTPPAARSAAVEPAAIRGPDISGVSTIRSSSAHEPAHPPKPLSQAPPSTELRATADQKSPTTATVIGHTNAGKVILKAADQHFRIEQQVNLPLGMTLQATLVSGVPAMAAPIDPGTAGDPATHLTKLIELLDDIDRAGRQATEADRPSAAKQLPAPDRHLASRFLGLLAVQDQQQPEGRLSPSPERSGLNNAQRDQIQGLVRELGAMASEPLADGWKGLTLPLGSDQGQAVALYFRDHDLDPEDEGQNGDADHAETQRAVFEVSLSRLGRCQIDALCQNQRFDLQIRSENPLAQNVQQDIAALFISACEIAGMNGEIGFKIGNFFEPARSSATTKTVQT